MRSRSEIQKTGRRALHLLLDPVDPIDNARIQILANDTVWAAMDEIGATNAFGTIDYLKHLNTNELADVASDWITVTWWTDAMLKVGPRVSGMLRSAAGLIGDPTSNAEFMHASRALSDALQEVTANAQAPFNGGWGIVAMYLLSGQAASINLDVAWSGGALQYARAPELLAGTGSDGALTL